MAHECCSSCDHDYLSKALGREVCCHLQLIDEIADFMPPDPFGGR